MTQVTLSLPSPVVATNNPTVLADAAESLVLAIVTSATYASRPEGHVVVLGHLEDGEAALFTHSNTQPGYALGVVKVVNLNTVAVCLHEEQWSF